MKLLLDTHAALWWWDEHQRLSAPAKKAISAAGNQIYFSAASAWEIATKNRLGKLPVPTDFLASIERYVADEGWVALPVSINHSQLAGSWPVEHRDPFDRMLAAQARLEKLTLVTLDEAFEEFGIKTHW
jgi:PIN domain nuclease of toxin-antitoxin system